MTRRQAAKRTGERKLQRIGHRSTESEHEAAQRIGIKLSAFKEQLEAAEEQNATLRGKIDKLVARYRQLQESKKADRVSADKADELREAHEASIAKLRAELTLWQRGERMSESTESALAQGEATLNGLRGELESVRAKQNRAHGRPASFSVEMCVRVAGELWCLVRAHRDQPSSEDEKPNVQSGERRARFKVGQMATSFCRRH